MSGKLVSIILPVYNVKDYLDRCMDSILSQDYNNFECIMVDDGSTDGSSELCNLYAEKDARCKVIHQKNGGLSVARNKAMEKASGELVVFVDSDDHWMPEFLSRMIYLMETNNADVVKCDYWRGEVLNETADPTIKVIDGKQFTKEILCDHIGSQLWQYVFKRELWRGVTSPQGRYAQDMMILHTVTDRAERVCITSEKLYFYFIDRSDSTSNAPKKKIKGAFDRAMAFKSRYDFAVENGYQSEQNELLQKTMDYFNNGVTLKPYRDHNYDADIDALSNFLKRNKSQWLKMGILGQKNRLLGLFLAYMPSLYCLMKGNKI